MPTWAAAVPDDARRHFNRGMAAVEIAKTPEDYDLAIKEFRQAQSLAPDWPDAYYNLGLLQEKSGKYRDAASSLRRYLQLVPDSPDAAAVRALIDKAEFKAEQVLTVPDIIDVLASLSYEQIWQVAGNCKKDNFDKYSGHTNDFRRLDFKRESHDAVKSLMDFQYVPQLTFQILKVTGPVLKYVTTRNLSGGGTYQGKVLPQNAEYTAVMEHEVTVVSKNLVRVNQRVVTGGAGNGVSTGDRFSCTFKKE